MNLKDNDPSLIGISRLRERIVVTPDWFTRVQSLIAGLKLMADGMYPDEHGAFLPRNLHIKQMLRELDLDGDGAYEPIKHQRG